MRRTPAGRPLWATVATMMALSAALIWVGVVNTLHGNTVNGITVIVIGSGFPALALLMLILVGVGRTADAIARRRK